MKKMVRQPFTPGGKFVASRDFKFHGKKYAKGSEFPWRRLSCSIRKLRQLYEGRFLNNEYVEPEELIDSQEETVLVEEEVTKGAVNNSEDDSLDEITVYDPEVHEIVNPDRGEWYLDLNGEHLLRLTAKEAKRLRKKMEPEDINMDKVIEE